MKIEGIVVSCYKHDLYLTRVCVASIRFWYRDLPIWLLKDRGYGDFSTTEIERHWDVQVYPSRKQVLGWGFGKLEVMTELPARRLLFIDSDIVFVGRLIERLEKFQEDFVVDKEDYDPAGIETQFFALDKLRQIDAGFNFTGWGFNGGQILATTGRISKEDLNGLFDCDGRKVKYPDIFKMGDQGLTNYLVQRKIQERKLTLHREPFMVWPGHLGNLEHISVADLSPEGKHQELIHWAGLRWGRRISEMPRSDILLHFENLYYRRIPQAGLKRAWRMTVPHLRDAVLKRPLDRLRALHVKTR